MLQRKNCAPRRAWSHANRGIVPEDGDYPCDGKAAPGRGLSGRFSATSIRSRHRIRPRGERTRPRRFASYFAIDFGWLPDVRAPGWFEPLLISAGEVATLLFFLLVCFFAFFIFFLPGAVVCAAAFGSLPDVRAFG